MQNLLTLADIASAAKISSRTLARRIAAGEGPRVIRIGKHRRVTEQDAAAWLTNRPTQ